MTAASNFSEASRPRRTSTPTVALAVVQGGLSRGDRLAHTPNNSVHSRTGRPAAGSRPTEERTDDLSHVWVAYARPGPRPMPNEANNAVSLPRRFSRCATAAVIVSTAMGLSGSNHELRVESRLLELPNAEISTFSAAEDGSARSGVNGSPNYAYRLSAARLTSPATMHGVATSAAPLTAAFPNLLNALGRVPVKAKLQVLLTLLMSESAPAQRADLLAKLQGLLKLPEYVLLEILQHPDLADFNKMLDAVFFGDTELWWIASELNRIDVVPVTATSDRIDVSGKPAYLFNSTSVAHNGDGGQASPALKSLAPASAAPQGAMMKLSQVEETGGVTTFAAAPMSNDVQVNEFSMSAPAAEVVPSPAPSPAPEPSPAPAASLAPASTNAEISRGTGETQLTTSPDVFDGGNRFEPGATISGPTTQNTPGSETATPSSSAPPPADDGTNNSPGAPSENTNEGGPSPGSEPS